MAVKELEKEPELDMAPRHEQTSLDSTVRIDREKGELYGVRVMGIKSAHGYSYSLAAQKEVVGRYEQCPLGLDHDFKSNPMTIGDTWGVLFNPRVDDKGTIADVKYLKSHVRTEQILEDAERDIGLFSLSAVTSRVVENKATRIVSSFVPVRVDLVTRGATTRKLFEQDNPDYAADVALEDQVTAILREDGETESAVLDKITIAVKAHYAINAEAEAKEVAVKEAIKDVTEEVAEAVGAAMEQETVTVDKVVFEQMQTTLSNLEKRVLLHEQFVDPKATVQKAVEETTKGFDLKAFWNDGTPTEDTDPKE